MTELETTEVEDIKTSLAEMQVKLDELLTFKANLEKALEQVQNNPMLRSMMPKV